MDSTGREGIEAASFPQLQDLWAPQKELLSGGDAAAAAWGDHKPLDVARVTNYLVEEKVLRPLRELSRANVLPSSGSDTTCCRVPGTAGPCRGRYCGGTGKPAEARGITVSGPELTGLLKVLWD
ncbi:hypothetical protein P7K49_014021 [Saguinus oedipus]|uniref:Uncharacterized protein n=1 Tax=Saguinus oedipus TaxID=9490 RepID=A0ABQ9VHR6_SAGOE|nr:hypothetical protein P7K49_014021 [Saguinus oedipus]